jgi:hypothetical protein
MVDPPTISIGTPDEYAFWVARYRSFLAELGVREDEIQQIDARYNYRNNRITIYRLPDPADELSVTETISHETLHALLYQTGEGRAARRIDLVAKPPGNSERSGGV